MKVHRACNRNKSGVFEVVEAENQGRLLQFDTRDLLFALFRIHLTYVNRE